MLNERMLLDVSLMTIYAGLLIVRRHVKAKKPLVYTARVKRLTLALMMAALATMIYVDSYIICSLAIAFSFMYVIVIGSLMSPIESMIKKSYYNDAKRKMQKMKNLKVIGITGSYGKTSTKHVVAHILGEKFYTLMTPGSYNTDMGVTITVRNMLKPIHEVFVVEMGAKQTGDIAKIAKLVNPDIGILTSIGPQHLDTFKTLDNIKKTKYELIDNLKEESLAIFNEENENVKEVSGKRDKDKIYYGLNEVEDIKYTKRGTEFKYKGELFVTKLLGKLNVLNIVAGIKVAESMGMDLNEISAAVRTLESVEHRLELLNKGNMTVIDDAFNSNPEGFEMALDVLKHIEGNNKILVTPGMIELGDKQYELNKEVGIKAAKACDYVVLVGEKQTRPIKDGLDEAGFKKVYIAKSLNEAVNHVSSIASNGDVVLYENDLPDTFNE
jgi:UDP-N-acetylmuramoyl-tripeptide--D-alanyl-D-alanine ligase